MRAKTLIQQKSGRFKKKIKIKTVEVRPSISLRVINVIKKLGTPKKC